MAATKLTEEEIKETIDRVTQQIEENRSYIMIKFEEDGTGIESILPINTTPLQMLYAAATLRFQGEYQLGTAYAMAEQQKRQEQLEKMRFEQIAKDIVANTGKK